MYSIRINTLESLLKNEILNATAKKSPLTANNGVYLMLGIFLSIVLSLVNAFHPFFPHELNPVLLGSRPEFDLSQVSLHGNDSQDLQIHVLQALILTGTEPFLLIRL